MDDRPFLSMALLAYNERDSIELAARRSSRALARCGKGYELILVDDGSTDGTADAMDRLAEELPFCRVIRHSAHVGLGVAIRMAYFGGRGEWATWFPADLQADPGDLPGLVERLEKCDVLVTYRNAASRRASLGRKLVSLFDRLLVRLLFGLKLRDLHWVRFFRRRLLDQMHLDSQSPSIDTEMMIQARRLGGRILEMPLEDHPRTVGKAKGAGWFHVLTSFRDLLLLWARERFVRVLVPFPLQELRAQFPSPPVSAGEGRVRGETRELETALQAKQLATERREERCSASAWTRGLRGARTAT